MAAASELFGQRGFDGVRVEQIARRAGVNKAMISYHFGGKQSLYTAILEDLFAGIHADLEALGGVSGAADERLRQFVAVMAAHNQRHPGFAAMLLREVIAGGPHIPDAMLPRFLEVFRALRGIVEEGVREGTFRAVDPILAHLTILGSLLFFYATDPMRVRIHRTGNLPPGVELPTPESFLVHIKELMARGLSAETPPAPSRR
jgi:AcrR family transcriptional regulator